VLYLTANWPRRGFGLGIIEASVIWRPYHSTLSSTRAEFEAASLGVTWDPFSLSSCWCPQASFDWLEPLNVPRLCSFCGSKSRDVTSQRPERFRHFYFYWFGWTGRHRLVKFAGRLRGFINVIKRAKYHFINPKRPFYTVWRFLNKTARITTRFGLF